MSDFSQTSQKMGTKEMLDKGHRFSTIGLFVCLFAFAMSVTSPWVISSFKPAPIPVEVVKEEPQSIKDKVITAVMGEKEPPPPIILPHWTDQIALAVVLIALAGIFNSCIGLLQKENQIVAGVGLMLGVSAIIAQYAMIALGVFLFLMLVIGILSAMGLSF